jgi:hypothetical protein
MDSARLPAVSTNEDQTLAADHSVVAARWRRDQLMGRLPEPLGLATQLDGHLGLTVR